MASRNDPKQNGLRSIHPEGSTKEGERESIQILAPNEGSPPVLANQDSSIRERHYRLERRKFWVEVTTLIILLAYTTITFWQWRAMKDTLQIAHRAYISIEDVQITDVMIDADMTLSFRLKNTGQVPADGVLCSFSNAKGPGVYSRPNPIDAGDVIAPGEVRAFTKSLTKSEGPVPIIGMLPPFFNRQDLIEAREGKKFLFVTIEVDYRDGFFHKRKTWRRLVWTPATMNWQLGGARQD